MNFRFLFLLFLLVLCCIYPSSVSAAEEMTIDFKDSNLWEFYPNDGKYQINNSNVKLEASSNYATMFPYLKTINNIFPGTGKISIDIDMKFDSIGGFGTGIAISPNNPQSNNTDITSSITNYTLFNIWQNVSDGFNIYAWICRQNESGCVLPQRITIDSNKFNYLRNNFRFEYNESGNYRIYINGSADPVFISEANQLRPYGIWIGHSLQTHSASSWTSFEINKIIINKKSFTPIIIIPGLGASWDFPALLNGEAGNNWKIPSFIGTYQSLIKSFENVGYTLDKDLFIFSYDWRKPIDTLSNELSAFIIGKITPNQKVNIVGHSLGGLISRIYEQKNGSTKVNKLVTLGSPHQGVLEAYGVWEGATVWGNVWWEKAALELSIQVNQKIGENRVDTLRAQAPVFKDLLPTYDFLKLNGGIRSWNQLSQKNEYLFNMNGTSNQVLNLTAFYGNNEQTKSIVKTIPRSGVDALMGMWEDGKPIDKDTFTYVDGDGTVTSQSAIGNFTSKPFSANHIGLVWNQQVLEEIFTLFDLDNTKVEIVSDTNNKNLFSAILKSPGRLEVCDIQLGKCDNELGIYIPEYKLFMMPEYKGEDLRIRVIENNDGFGDYKLHIGNINTSSNWNIISGSIENDEEIDTYDVKTGTNTVSIFPDNSTSNSMMKQCKTNLNMVSPNWDSGNNTETALNTNLSSTQRLKATRLVKMSLRNEMKKAKISNKPDNIRQALTCWNDVDFEVKNILSSGSRGSNTYQQMVTKFGNTVASKLNTSKYVLSSEIFTLAKQRLNESILVTNNIQLSNELTSSSEQLMLTALDLK